MTTFVARQHDKRKQPLRPQDIPKLRIRTPSCDFLNPPFLPFFEPQ